jgi:hypothetical protein
MVLFGAVVQRHVIKFIETEDVAADTDESENFSSLSEGMPSWNLLFEKFLAVLKDKLENIFKYHDLDFLVYIALASAVARSTIATIFYLVILLLHVFFRSRYLSSLVAARVMCFVSALLNFVQFGSLLGLPAGWSSWFSFNMTETQLKWWLLSSKINASCLVGDLAFLIVATIRLSRLLQAKAVSPDLSASDLPSDLSNSLLSSDNASQVDDQFRKRSRTVSWLNQSDSVLWHQFVLSVAVFVDKTILLLIAVFGCFQSGIIDIGFVLFPMLVMFERFRFDRDSDDLREKTFWRWLHGYTLIAILLFLVAQKYFFVSDSSFILVIFFGRDEARNRQLALMVITYIFLDIQAQVRLSESDFIQYVDGVKMHVAQMRGKLRTAYFKLLRESLYSKNENLKMGLRKNLEQIVHQIRELNIDPFLDEEVWPSPPVISGVSGSSTVPHAFVAHVPEQGSALLLATKENISFSFGNAIPWMRASLSQWIDVSMFVSDLDKIDPSLSVAHVWLSESKANESLTMLSLAFRALHSNLQVLCAMMFFLNLIFNPSLISLIVPIGMLVSQMLEHFGSSKMFWKFCIFYVQLIVVLKLLFQLPIVCFSGSPVNSSLILVSAYDQCLNSVVPSPISWWGMLGLFKLNLDNLAWYLCFDLLCLVSLSWLRRALIDCGRWDFDLPELGDEICQQMFNQYDLLLQGIPFEVNLNDDPVLVQTANSTVELDSMFDRLLMRFPVSVRLYFFSLAPPKRFRKFLKPGHDLYFYAFCLKLLQLVIIFFGYDSMASKPSILGSAFKVSHFNGWMIVHLMYHILIIVADRVFYLRHSTRLKVILHYLTIACTHILIFYVWPQGNDIPLADCPVRQLFYSIELLYFFSSAMQLRYGYPTFIEHDYLLARNVSAFGLSMFLLYSAIPFLYEMRSILDWLCRKTSLTFLEHVKFEEIYWRIYTVKCNLQDFVGKKRGEPVAFFPGKLLNGMVLFCCILLLLIGPLILFSSFNYESDNLVLQMKVSVQVRGPGNVHNLFQSTELSLSVNTSIKDPDFADLYTYAVQNYIINPDTDVGRAQVLRAASFSHENWLISPPSFRSFIALLQDDALDYYVDLQFSFLRPGPKLSTSVDLVVSSSVDSAFRSNLASLLVNGSFIDASGRVSNLLPLPLRAPRFVHLEDSSALIIADQQFYNYTMGFHRDEASGSSYFTLINSESATGVQVVTISDPLVNVDSFAFLKSNAASISVVTIYATIVLTISRFLRLLSVGNLERIPFEDWNSVDSLELFCQGMLIARKSKQFYREEELYRQLIKLLRTPAALIVLTRRKDHVKTD